MRTKKQHIGKGNNCGNKNSKNKETSLPVETSTKKKRGSHKAATGFIRLGGRDFPLITDNLPQEELHYAPFGDETMHVTGRFVGDDGQLHYVLRGTKDQSKRAILSQEKFKDNFPGIIPSEETHDVPGGYPVQKGWCRNCRGTTARIIGESNYMMAWELYCPHCGSKYFESKSVFAQKYIGVDGYPPDYPQREPKIPHGWHDENQGNKLSSKLEDAAPNAKWPEYISTPSLLQDSEPSEDSANTSSTTETTNAENQVQSNGASIQSPSMKFSVENGKIFMHVNGAKIQIESGMAVTLEGTADSPNVSIKIA